MNDNNPPDPEYVINPNCDARCRRSEVLFCEYMHLGIASGNNWLIVHLKNGGKLESELMKKQPDLERTMTRMYLDGIRIHKTTCALVDS